MPPGALYSRQELRALATLSLANASGCDGGNFVTRPNSNFSLQTSTVSRFNQIHNIDCVQGLKTLPDESVQLAFADPPFNIGYSYDVYDDRQEHEHYLDWCSEWMEQLYRVLVADGTFWLAIGDEYAAELKIRAQEAGFRMRSWVIWYYTFGVHCKYKFTRSHAHLFYFTKDEKKFCFNVQEIAVPSARQLIYADRRANPKGRTPDDTWILRPQDCRDAFNSNEDIWYFPRVNGTFKERAGFHGCQMPEQLLGRIIRACSQPGDIVIDPFSGSATTLVVAKKLDRQFIGFELSEEYSQRGRERLEGTLVGDKLEGAEDPKVTVASRDEVETKRSRNKKQSRKNVTLEHGFLPGFLDLSADEAVDQKLAAAFTLASRGTNVERLILDPTLNSNFQFRCDELEIPGTPEIRNRQLFKLRSDGKLSASPTEKESPDIIGWDTVDPFWHASEIAWRQLSDRFQCYSLEELFCSPSIASEFDALCRQLAPGFSPLEYRLGALRFRSELDRELARAERGIGETSSSPSLDEEVSTPILDLDPNGIPCGSGIYRLEHQNGEVLYIGMTLKLDRRIQNQFSAPSLELLARWLGPAQKLSLRWCEVPIEPTRPLERLLALISKQCPPLNLPM